VRNATWKTTSKLLLALSVVSLFAACGGDKPAESDADVADNLGKVGSVDTDAAGMEGMSGMSGMSGMEGMSGMSGMAGQEGMSGMSGMAGMEGMSGMSGMAGAGGADQTDLATSKGCMACHKVDMKVVGPAYQEVAAKYKGDPAAVDMLIAKVKAGGQGNWGEIPMPPNPAVSDEDISALVNWILSM